MTFWFLTKSQNYVNVTSDYINNPSFEDNDTCDGTLNKKVICNNWYAPTEGTSDWFNFCINAGTPGYPGGTTLPDNLVGGYQNPFHGNGHVGLFSKQDQPIYYTEYIQTKLKKKLNENKLYKFSFRLNLGNRASDSYTKNISALFFKDSIYRLDYKPIDKVPQIYSPNYVSDTLNWVLCSGIFQANGNEQFLTLGNFGDSLLYCKPAPNVDTTGFYYCLSYYYIDSLNLLELQDVFFDINTFNINIMTPNNDGVNDIINFEKYNLKELFFEVYNRWGSIVFKTQEINAKWNGKNDKESPLNDGVYYYVLTAINQNNEKIIKHNFLSIIR